ncbi:MAG: DUF359 domain-containing protein [Desulfurococcaceae archaeon]|uniref:DUF359 domain-containing protein n=1 Tax=Staphylothermus marinus TaxID=2280 RepID=A0A7C4NLK5_STAMA
MASLKLPCLTLLPEYRLALSTPLSKLYVSYTGYVKGLEVQYSVGDVVSVNQNSRYKIVDWKTRRKEHVERMVRGDRLVLVNPPGSLSLNAFTMLKAKHYGLFEVVGEEDLLVLITGREGDVVYGQPGVGVVVLKKNPFYLSSLIKGFKPVVSVYEFE